MSQVQARLRLDGKVALVTGAAGGIGRASAEALAGAGARVVAADLDEARVAWAGDALADQGAGLGVDVADRTSVVDLVAATVQRFGSVDVLVNAAGISTTARIGDLTDDDLDRVLAINLKGTLFCCQAVLAPMRAAGGGSIVNIASGAAFVGAPHQGAYTMSKTAVVGLTRVLATEEGRHGIRVNAVAPGFVRTPMTLRRVTADDGTVDEEGFERIAAPNRAFSPLGRIGEPDDIAAAVLYLASDAAAWVTGQVLHSNGGSVMA
jgi:3-oxoacyl-[acyl-carrier protein] reductase